MNILITICARGGSKGIPGKNIKILNGKPLIGYSIDLAKKFQNKYKTVDIVLSTDSEEIIKVAQECGLSTSYRRPEYLANDTCGKVDVIRDVVTFQEEKLEKSYDLVLDLDCTSPLRNIDDLSKAFDMICSDEKAVNLFSVSEANRSPYFNMVEQKENGYYAQIKKVEVDIFTRQSAPKVYDLNASFYFYKKRFFDEGYQGAITDKSLIYIVPHICFDLDHQLDFEIISYLMEQNKLDFEL